MLDMARITIKDKDYVLRFPLGNMLKAEKALGKPLQKLFLITKDSQGKVVVPDYSLEDLVKLFKVGLAAEHPEFSQEEAENLLTEFLTSGSSLLVQTSVLYTLLGKALGFFRTGVDIQKVMNDKTEEILSKKL